MSMTIKTRPEMIQAIIDAHSTDEQTNKTVEELGELIVAIAKMRAAPTWIFSDEDSRIAAVVEEIADCRIMLDQMAVIFGTDKVELAENLKLERMADRLGFALHPLFPYVHEGRDE
jgi:NTP pyrophosphatase (non-canonical NTP hydrolase)